MIATKIHHVFGVVAEQCLAAEDAGHKQQRSGNRVANRRVDGRAQRAARLRPDRHVQRQQRFHRATRAHRRTTRGPTATGRRRTARSFRRTRCTIPHHAMVGTNSPRMRAMTAAQIGWVATSATDDATDVKDRLGIHDREVSGEHHPGENRQPSFLRARPQPAHLDRGDAPAPPARARADANTLRYKRDHQRRRGRLPHERCRERHRHDGDGEEHEVDRVRAADGGPRFRAVSRHERTPLRVARTCCRLVAGASLADRRHGGSVPRRAQ